MKIPEFAARLIYASVVFLALIFFLHAPSWGAIGIALILAHLIIPVRVENSNTIFHVKKVSTFYCPEAPSSATHPLRDGDMWWNMTDNSIWEFEDGIWKRQP